MRETAAKADKEERGEGIGNGQGGRRVARIGRRRGKKCRERGKRGRAPPGIGRDASGGRPPVS